jgi:lipopolysaccharide export system permease protein
MPVTTVITLITLRVAISLEVLLPTVLYLSVIIGLGRLYKDSEITALFASGIGIRQVVKVVFTLAFCVALLVAGISLYLRPWAYGRSFTLKAKAEAEFDLTRLKAGRFYEIGEGNQVIFLEKIDHQQERAEGVFMLKEDDGMLRVIYARQARREVDPKNGAQVVLFSDGGGYEFPRKGKGAEGLIKFDHSMLSLIPKIITPTEYKIKAASTAHLLQSDIIVDIAELQRRLSAPISAILLALIGVPLSRTTPREGKYARMGTAVLLCALYYGVGTMAKIWLEQGVVKPLPGIWWVQGLMTALLVILLLAPSQQFRPLKRKR